MTMRRTNKAEEIELLKNELAIKKMLLESIVKRTEKNGALTAEDRKAADEAKAFIDKNARIIKNFYKPAEVVA